MSPTEKLINGKLLHKVERLQATGRVSVSDLPALPRRQQRT
jgi:hypothetical protein